MAVALEGERGRKKLEKKLNWEISVTSAALEKGRYCKKRSEGNNFEVNKKNC